MRKIGGKKQSQRISRSGEREIKIELAKVCSKSRGTRGDERRELRRIEEKRGEKRRGAGEIEKSCQEQGARRLRRVA